MKKKDDILEKKEIVENEKSLDGTIVEQKIEKAKEEKQFLQKNFQVF